MRGIFADDNTDDKLRELPAEFIAAFRGQIVRDAPMSAYTSWRIGGAADWLLSPACAEDVLAVLELCAQRRLPLTVIGRGTNLLVSDRGIAGVVLRIGEAFDKVEHLPGERVRAGAGTLLAALSKATAERGLTGLEWACGIPGNLGGALMMNAGAYGSAIGEIVTEVEVAAYIGAEKGAEDGASAPRAAVQTLSGEDLAFAYRSGCLPQGTVALAATLQLAVGDAAASRERIREILASRSQSQPLEYPSAGSVFRNPPGSHAGYLIEQAGLKGLAVGGAEVSRKHANFIINTGGAKAADVLRLIDQVRETVAAKTGYTLETEVRLLGRKTE